MRLGAKTGLFLEFPPRSVQARLTLVGKVARRFPSFCIDCVPMQAKQSRFIFLNRQNADASHLILALNLRRYHEVVPLFRPSGTFQLIEVDPKYLVFRQEPAVAQRNAGRFRIHSAQIRHCRNAYS